MTDAPRLRIEESSRTTAAGEAVVLALAGRLDHATAPQLREAGETACRGAPAALIIDLAGVDFVASAGFRVLLTLRRRADAAQTRLRLAGAGAAVRGLFDVSRFAEVFVLHDDLDAALNAEAEQRR